jgi:hypothetical protein
MENMFKARVSSLPQKVDLPFHESNGKNLGMSPKPASPLIKLKGYGFHFDTSAWALQMDFL